MCQIKFACRRRRGGSQRCAKKNSHVDVDEVAVSVVTQNSRPVGHDAQCLMVGHRGASLLLSATTLCSNRIDRSYDVAFDRKLPYYRSVYTFMCE